MERLVFEDREAPPSHVAGGTRGFGVSEPLPYAWQSYSCLQSLSICSYHTQTDLPEWLPDLKRLTELELPRVLSNDFLTGLLQLTGLQRLSLVHAMIDWTAEMVDLASLPNLCYLNLGWWGYYERDRKAWYTDGTQEERTNLKALERALNNRPLQLEKQTLKTWDGRVVPDVY